MDKFVTQLVEDKDILAYQEMLYAAHGGRKFEVSLDVYFSQQFVTTAGDDEYFARKYNSWGNDEPLLFSQNISGS